VVQAPAVFETAALIRAWLPQQLKNFVKSLIKPFFIWVSIQVNITIKISRTNEIKTINLTPGSTVQDVLTKINMKPDTLIVINKNSPIPIDQELKNGEELTILQVSSGG
jgi:sulfur carrier protein ThiS